MKVCWNITSRCNKNCQYCFKFEQQELSLEENKKILDNLVKRNVTSIGWSGGEPFLYKDFTELLKLSKKKGLINHVHTNASLLTNDNLEKKIKHIDRLIISLDFIKEEDNLRYGIGNNYYKHIISILKDIKKIKPGIEVQINTVVFKGTLKKLEEIYNELLNYDIDYWKLIRFFPIRGKALDKNLSITNEEYEEVINKFKKRDNQKFKIIIHGIQEMSKRHIIVLSSGELVYSENGEDIEIEKKLT